MTTLTLSDLNDRDSSILKLKWVEERTNGDITSMVGWSKSTISRTVRKFDHIKDQVIAHLSGAPVSDTTEVPPQESVADTAEIPAHFVSTDVVTVAIDGKIHTFDRTHPNYESVRDAVVGQDWEAVSENADYQKKFKKLTFGFFEINEYGEIFHQGQPLEDNDFSDTIISLHEKDIKPAALLKFIERLKENPSLTSIESAVRFIKNNRLPIDSAGFLLTYKKIKSNYTDCHTGTIDNSIGQVVAMKRDDVTLNPSQTCASGLHVCSKSYLSHFGGDRIVVCKVDPADIVSVPHDYNNAKMRVMRYEVIHELKNGESIPDDYIDETCDWYN